MPVSLDLSEYSRFKQTNLYTQNGVTFFGLWNPPNIQMDGNEKVIEVGPSNVGSLDSYAKEEYGTRELWWVIALVNDINDVEAEIVVGKRLKIPKDVNVRKALSAEEN